MKSATFKATRCECGTTAPLAVQIDETGQYLKCYKCGRTYRYDNMNVDQLIREKPRGMWRVYLKRPRGGYIDVVFMWEYYMHGTSYIDVYIHGGNVPNPFTGRMPTNSMVSSRNESDITISNIERVERL